MMPEPNHVRIAVDVRSGPRQYYDSDKSRFLQLTMAPISPIVLYPDETDVDEEEEINLDEFHRDAWDLDEDFILQQHSK